jgi:hypothetical protein
MNWRTYGKHHQIEYYSVLINFPCCWTQYFILLSTHLLAINRSIYTSPATDGAMKNFWRGWKKSHAPLLAAAVLPAARELVAPWCHATRRLLLALGAVPGRPEGGRISRDRPTGEGGVAETAGDRERRREDWCWGDRRRREVARRQWWAGESRQRSRTG